MRRPALFILFFFSIQSQAQPDTINIGSITRFQSDVLGEERPLYIHLPESYGTSTNYYPVLLVLDGEWNFRKTVGIVEHLSESGRIPAMIVVGIPNVFRAGRPSRIEDLAPAASGSTEEAGADRFLRFITEELVPDIDKQYRTQPHRTLLGHSLGGLFTVFALLEKPDSFSAFISISPSLGRNNQQQVKRMTAFFDRNTSLKKNLQLGLGDEGGNTQLGTEALVKILDQSVPQDFDWQFRHMKDEDHASVFHNSTYQSLESIFKGWKIPETYLSDLDISIAERHYQALSDRIGFEVPVPEAYYYQLGYRILSELEFDYAAWTFDRYAQAYPTAATAWVGLGDVQLMQGQIESALSFYEKALTINPAEERASRLVEALKAP